MYFRNHGSTVVDAGSRAGVATVAFFGQNSLLHKCSIDTEHSVLTGYSKLLPRKQDNAFCADRMLTIQTINNKQCILSRQNTDFVRLGTSDMLVVEVPSTFAER